MFLNVAATCASVHSVLQAFLEIIINLQFQLVETLWMSFWRKVHTGNLERYSHVIMNTFIRQVGRSTQKINDKQYTKYKKKKRKKTINHSVTSHAAQTLE